MLIRILDSHLILLIPCVGGLQFYVKVAGISHDIAFGMCHVACEAYHIVCFLALCMFFLSCGMLYYSRLCSSAIIAKGKYISV